jgi:hypothetical protein
LNEFSPKKPPFSDYFSLKKGAFKVFNDFCLDFQRKIGQILFVGLQILVALKMWFTWFNLEIIKSIQSLGMLSTK